MQFRLATLERMRRLAYIRTAFATHDSASRYALCSNLSMDLRSLLQVNGSAAQTNRTMRDCMLFAEIHKIRQLSISCSVDNELFNLAFPRISWPEIHINADIDVARGIVFLISLAEGQG